MYVRELRTRLALSQGQLAARLGVSNVTVSRWENGRSGISASARRRLGQLEHAGQAEWPPAGAPPLPLSSFVGRESEIARVTALLSGSRLVCLAGPGGTGKTRLALEVLRRRPVRSAAWCSLPWTSSATRRSYRAGSRRRWESGAGRG